MIEPIDIIVWTYVLVFLSTAVITLGGIVSNFNYIQVNEKYLKALFAALILEIVVGGVALSKDFLSVNSITPIQNHSIRPLIDYDIFRSYFDQVSHSGKFRLNKDLKSRNHILGLPEKIDEVEYIHNIDLVKLQKLLKHGHISPDSTTEFSPTVFDFYIFMKSNPHAQASATVVGGDRTDYRVDLWGISIPKIYATKETAEKMFEFCSGSREQDFTEEFSCSWYD
ncbi:MAG: hypothetical protein ACRBB6_00230 [Neptuniibacter sp.]